MNLMRLFPLLCCVFILFACSNNRQPVAKEIWGDTTAFPKKAFSFVSLYTIDSTRTAFLNSGGVDSNSFELTSGPGYTFVGKNGIPKTKDQRSFNLDSTQIAKLVGFLTQQPCEGSVVDKNCLATYRDVFVFYDSKKNPIAHTHICFECEKTSFVPFSTYMCDFDNTVNWSALKQFVQEITRGK